MRAVERVELLGMRHRLDAFRDDAHPELAGQLHDGPADDVVLVRAHPRDERAIELQRIDRIPLQVAERGVSGPEVVEMHGDADPVQPIEVLIDDVGMVHEDAFGDLELQALRKPCRCSPAPSRPRPRSWSA